MAAIALGILLGGSQSFFALNPALDISQYGHTAWRIRDGFAAGTAFAMAQTPDGYLWLGTDQGLFRSDGVRFVRWEPPAGQHLPGSLYSLLVSRDGTLWIGTFSGLASWKDGKLTQYPGVGRSFVTSLLEDRDGTVWAGLMDTESEKQTGLICALRAGKSKCFGQDGSFGSFVWSLEEDSSGTLWAAAESGLWRWRPGQPKLYTVPGERLADLTLSPDGRLLAGIRGGGLRQFAGDKLQKYPIPATTGPGSLLQDSEVDSNKLLRDREGGLWIGTNQRGLIHVHQGRTDVFTEADGLSGNIIAGLFEDREGNIWVSTAGGLDRFRELSVTTITAKQGLSSDNVNSVVTSKGGSTWIATRDGLTRWKNGKFTVFHAADGLPGDFVQSMYKDPDGPLWVFAGHELAHFSNGRFVATPGIPSTEVYSMAGDNAGNLWLSGNRGLSHLRDGRLIEQIPWAALGRKQQAKVVIFDRQRGGLWLAFWMDGGVDYFKDGRVRSSYTAANGLGRGPVASIRLDRDGAVWAATQESGVSRIADGRVTTMTTANGLPCNKVHWTTEDTDGSLWAYTGCGLLRISRNELDAWIADPKHRLAMTVWDAADGAMPLSAPSYFGPTYAQSADGKLWYATREDIEVIDPRHLPDNRLPPPVHIEKMVADGKTYWQNLPAATLSNVRLPARTRDLDIDFTGLSLVAPEKVHFRYKLEGQDSDWREVIDKREAQYSNLAPGPYRFRVKASNNSGMWNEAGDSLAFSIAPAYYQTDWFRILCAALVLALLWLAYRLRVRQLHHQFALTLEARVAERTSIARDLHDTLLQSAHGLLLQLEVLSQIQATHPNEAREKLAAIIDRTARAITEGRDAVQGLRETTVQGNDLARAINALGEGLAADCGSDVFPRFQVTVEGVSRELHSILRDEVYRIAAEALRNAFHHAAASQIEVEIRYDKDHFRLRVRDNGKGMDQSVSSDKGREGHYGLPGMRERAKLIGGKLDIWSQIDAGTEVELRVSAATAYTTKSKRSWWSTLLARR